MHELNLIRLEKISQTYKRILCTRVFSRNKFKKKIIIYITILMLLVSVVTAKINKTQIDTFLIS